MLLTVFAIVPPALGTIEVLKRDALASVVPANEDDTTFRGRLAILVKRWEIGFVELLKKIIMVATITIMSSGNVTHLTGELEQIVWA